jgi:hypothetical protein
MHRSSPQQKTIMSLTILLLLASASPMLAADQPSSTTELQEILRTAKIVDANAPLRIFLREQEVFISTQRNPKASDDDCKIDAVLMAKTIMDACPTQILRVKVLFNNYHDNKASRVVITKGEIKSFGAREIDQKTLLNSLDYSTITAQSEWLDAGAASYAVSPGVFPERRRLLLGHIKILEKRGTNIKSFQTLFNQIEDSVRKKEDRQAIQKMIIDLASKLKEEDKLIYQASEVQKQPLLQRNKRGKFQQMQGINQAFPNTYNSYNQDPWLNFRRWQTPGTARDQKKETNNTIKQQ